MSSLVGCVDVVAAWLRGVTVVPNLVWAVALIFLAGYFLREALD